MPFRDSTLDTLVSEWSPELASEDPCYRWVSQSALSEEKEQWSNERDN